MEHDDYKKWAKEAERIQRLINTQRGTSTAFPGWPDWTQPNQSPYDSINPHQTNPIPPTRPDIHDRLDMIDHRIRRLTATIEEMAEEMAPQIKLIADVFDAMHIKEEDEGK